MRRRIIKKLMPMLLAGAMVVAAIPLSFASPTKAAEENILKGKTTMCTYQQDDGHACRKAVDEKFNTSRWGSSGNTPQAIQIDLGDVYEIDTIKAYLFGKDRKYTYEYYVTMEPTILKENGGNGNDNFVGKNPVVTGVEGVGYGWADPEGKTPTPESEIHTEEYTFNGNKPVGRYLTFRATYCSQIVCLWDIQAFGRKVDASAVKPEGDLILEAEKATLSGKCQVRDAGSCSNGQYVGYIGEGVDNTVTWKANVETAGTYTLEAYFLSKNARELEFKVNDGAKTTLACQAGVDWDNTVVKSNNTVTVKLKAGENTIVMGNDNGEAPNVDCVALTLKEASTEPEVQEPDTEQDTENTDTETEKPDTEQDTENTDTETEKTDKEQDSENTDTETEKPDTEQDSENKDTETEEPDKEQDSENTETEKPDKEQDSENTDTETEEPDKEQDTENTDTETEKPDKEQDSENTDTETEKPDKEQDTESTDTEIQEPDTEQDAEDKDSKPEESETEQDTENTKPEIQEPGDTGTEQDSETTDQTRPEESGANNNQNTQSPSQSNQQSNPQPSVTEQLAEVSKGDIYWYKNLKYKVTKADATGTGTVELVSTQNKKITTAIIPASIEIKGVKYSVTSIGKNAFKNCKNLKKIQIHTTQLKKVGKSALKGIKSNAKIKVPSSCLKKYTRLFEGKGQGKNVKIVK